MAQSSRPCADLPPHLLSFIADRHLDVRSYAACRLVCSAWRSALEPPSLALFGVSNDREAPCAAAFSLPLRRTLRLPKLPTHEHCIGSSDGWLALTIPTFECDPVLVDYSRPWQPDKTMILLVNPVSGEKITLPPLDPGRSARSVSKIVLAPNPSKDDFTAVAVYGVDALACVATGDSTWSVHEIPCYYVDHLADVVFDDAGGKLYCLTNRGDVHVMHVPHGAGHGQKPVVEPLLPEHTGLWFNPGKLFSPPYARLSKIAGAKHLALCDGRLYQIWRNTSSGFYLSLQEEGQGEGGGRRRVARDEIFVLRYDPGRQPYSWGAVTDLGGHSVFLGRSSALLARPGGAPWKRANCVYWISAATGPAMVFDMETRMSAPALSAPSAALNRTICWLGAMKRDKRNLS